MSAPHETPRQLEEILEKLREWQLEKAIVARGQYSPAPLRSERTLVYRQGTSRLAKIVDAWLAPADGEAVVSVLKARCETVVGACDAMYATAPRYVWATEARALQLWHRGVLVGSFTGDQCRVRRSLFHRWHAVPCTSLASVYVFLSPTWSRRGVMLERGPHPGVLVAAKKELSAWLDPTYDGIDLICDASWAVELARAIAATTGLPLRLHEDLQ